MRSNHFLLYSCARKRTAQAEKLNGIFLLASFRAGTAEKDTNRINRYNRGK